jgi:hypothetical protein
VDVNVGIDAGFDTIWETKNSERGVNIGYYENVFHAVEPDHCEDYEGETILH